MEVWMGVVIFVAISSMAINVVLTGLCFKLYTEFFKERVKR